MRKEMSSSSSRIHCMPIRPASGAKISIVSRAFCADCGTPLTYEADGCEPSIAAGAFDDPAALPPTVVAMLAFLLL